MEDNQKTEKKTPLIEKKTEIEQNEKTEENQEIQKTAENLEQQKEAKNENAENENILENQKNDEKIIKEVFNHFNSIPSEEMIKTLISNKKKNENSEKLEEMDLKLEDMDFPDNLDINALKEKMEALQKLLAPKQENFDELLKDNKQKIGEINDIIKDTEFVVKRIDEQCERALKNNFENYETSNSEIIPNCYKIVEKKIKKLKSKEERDHVEGLIERIHLNEKRLNMLSDFLKEQTGNHFLKDNFEFIEFSLSQENLMTENYLDYVFKQSN
jgi:hypothetical protein